MAKLDNEKKKNKHFWKDFKAELKKVIWPTKKQLTNNTMVVIAMVLVTAVIVLVLDLVFESLNTYGINKLKEVVQDSAVSNVEENSNEDATENNNEADDSADRDVENIETNIEQPVEESTETTTE